VKSRIVAILLAFFLGGFGVHQFYLGKLRGLWYLFFFWTFIPALMALVDFIALCVMSDKEFNKIYN
jgi:TM2 domain-containing membrane protein YozV